MVERHTEEFTDFIGTVEDIDKEVDKFNEDREEYHIQMKPEGIEVKGDTGFIHEWIKMSAKATDVVIPEGSVLDNYIKELEILNKDVKKMVSVSEVFAWMVGKKFRFVRKKLGRAYQGHEAKSYWTPVSLQ